MKLYSPEGERVFPKVTIEITLISTELSLQELTRIKKDLISTLPAELKLIITDQATSESLKKASLTVREVGVKLASK